MDTQQAYEQIREQFNSPGATLAKNAVGTCQYRVVDGDGQVKKCALGALIPDEVYSSTMEGNILCTEWLRRNPFMDGLLYGVDRGFLRAAQHLHDVVAGDARQFVKGLDLLAVLHGLTAPNSIISEDEFIRPLV